MRHESVASPQLLARRVYRQHRGRVSPQMAVDLERRLEPYGLAAQTAGIRELVTVAYGRPRGRQPVAGFGYVYVYAKRTPQPRWAIVRRRGTARAVRNRPRVRTRSTSRGDPSEPDLDPDRRRRA